jgi:hypothetical protein
MRFLSRLLPVWFLGCATMFLVLPGGVPATQPEKSAAGSTQAKKPTTPAKLITVSYDVGDIVAKRKFWDIGGQRLGVREALPKSILEYVPELAKQLVGPKAPHHIHLLNGRELQVHTDKKTHEEVKSLLEAMRRLLDLAVQVNCSLYEVDRKTYDREIAGKLPRHPGNPAVFVDPDFEETERKLLAGKLPAEKLFPEGRTPLKNNKITIEDGDEAEIFSWRTVVPYERNPAQIFLKKEVAIAHPGFSFSMTPVVSSDRRSTQIKLTQKVTQLVQWKKIKALQALPNQELKDVLFEVPVLQESTFTSTFTAADGWPVVVPVQWQRPGARGDDQLVLFFSARIVIEEEERAIRQQLEEEKKKKK